MEEKKLTSKEIMNAVSAGLPGELKEQLKWLREQNCNMVMPVTAGEALRGGREIGEIYQLSYSVFLLSPDPNGGDCWQDPRWTEWRDKNGNLKRKGRVALSFQALAKLKNEAGLTILETHRNDGFASSTYVNVSASGELRKLDGGVIRDMASSEIDMEVVRKQLEVQYAKRGMTSDERRAAIERDFLRKLVHKHANAESLAKARLIRQMLGIASTYEQEQFSRPWVVLACKPIIDFSDPMVKRIAVMTMFGATQALYGVPITGSNRGLPDNNESFNRDSIGEVVDDDMDVDSNEKPQTVEETGSSEATPQEPFEGLRGGFNEQEWLDAPEKERLQKIRDMIAETGYAPREGSRSPEQLNAKAQIAYIKFLREKRETMIGDINENRTFE